MMLSRIGVPVDYILFSSEHIILREVSRLHMFPAICVQQVRSKAVFLPENAELSKLDRARAVHKIRGWRKLWRELMRPFNNSISGFLYKWASLRRGGKWLFIKYR